MLFLVRVLPFFFSLLSSFIEFLSLIDSVYIIININELFIGTSEWRIYCVILNWIKPWLLTFTGSA
jgi:hypothetical protein